MHSTTAAIPITTIHINCSIGSYKRSSRIAGKELSNAKQHKLPFNSQGGVFKVPEFINVPTPGLHPSLKRRVSEDDRKPSHTTPGLLRVSFSDESFTEYTER